MLSDSLRLYGLALAYWPHGKVFIAQLRRLHISQIHKETQNQPRNLTATHTYANICFALIGVSLYVAVGTDKQCELTCRPAGYRFYVRQAERVRDGTPCVNVTSNDVCVEGRCLVSAFKPECEVDIVQNLGWLILTSRGWFKLSIQIQWVCPYLFVGYYSFLFVFRSFSHLHSWFVCQESGQQQLPIYTSNSEIKSGNGSPPLPLLLSCFPATPPTPTHTHIVWPIIHIISPFLPARLRVAMGCWALALWLTNVECVVEGTPPAKRWQEASKMSQFPLVTTRSSTSHQELLSLTSQREKPALITWVRLDTNRIMHRLFQISRTIMVGSFSKSELLVSLFVLALKRTVNFVASQRAR